MTTLLSETVTERDGKFCVVAESGKDMGCYDTKDEANERLRQIEAAKHAKESAVEIVGDTIPLVEKIGTDGTINLRIIKPGWGTSGYYNEALIRRDGPKAFPRGTHMYIDHPRASDERERPERSLNELAAVTVSTPAYDPNGPYGPGLYARSKVFSSHQRGLEEMAPHIGVSIRAMGKAESGEAEGKRGPIITEMGEGKSIDFVTKAGAGGQYAELFESLRTGTYDSASSRPNTEEDGMGDELKEVQARLAAREAELAEANKKLSEATARGDRAETALMLREAKDIAVTEVVKVDLPDVTRARIVESVTKNPPLKDGKLDEAALKVALHESAAFEKTYLDKATGNGSGIVRGMNGSTADDKVDVGKSLDESFRIIGLSEAERKTAVAGRG